MSTCIDLRVTMRAALPAAFSASLYALTLACFKQSVLVWFDALWLDRPPMLLLGGVVELDRQRLAFAVAASCFLELIFWLGQALLLAVYRQPLLCAQFRMAKSQPFPSDDLMRKCIDDVWQGHALRPLLLWLVHPVYRWRGTPFSSVALPPAATLCAHLAVAVAVDDTLFYWAHRAMHESRWLYRRVHKQHHEFRHAVGLAVEYAHPAEDLCNALITLAGPLLMGSHAAVAVGYAGVKLWQSIDAHSGMHLPFPLTPWNVLPFSDCAPAHDFHHSHNVGCYGGFFSFWDKLCGTDVAYQQFRNREAAGARRDGERSRSE